MIQITIEQGRDLSVESGKTTTLTVETRQGAYFVTASKTGDPAAVHRKFMVPRDGPKRLHALLADVFRELAR